MHHLPALHVITLSVDALTTTSTNWRIVTGSNVVVKAVNVVVAVRHASACSSSSGGGGVDAVVRCHAGGGGSGGARNNTDDKSNARQKKTIAVRGGNSLWRNFTPFLTMLDVVPVDSLRERVTSFAVHAGLL